MKNKKVLQSLAFLVVHLPAVTARQRTLLVRDGMHLDHLPRLRHFPNVDSKLPYDYKDQTILLVDRKAHYASPVAEIVGRGVCVVLRVRMPFPEIDPSASGFVPNIVDSPLSSAFPAKK